MGKMRVNRLAVGIVLLCWTLAGCTNTAKTTEEIPLVRSQTVKTDGAGGSSSYSGEVRGRYESQLAFQVSGKVIRRNVDLGSVVNAGDTLLEIDPKDISQAAVAAAAQVYSAESQLKLAESNLNRYRQLYDQGAVSQAQYDQYVNAYNAAVAAARQASAQHAQTANQMGYTALCADAAGVIAAVNAEVGQVVSAGQPVVTLVRAGEREVEINVPENHIAEVRQSGQIRVSFWALPNIAVDGRVREIAPVADKVTRTYKVRISLVDPPPEVRLGMTATVAVAAAGSNKSAFIPLSAIYQTGGSPAVWVVKDGSVSLRPVRTGAFGDNRVQVLEGLEDGEVIVTAGVHKLRQGQKIRTTGGAE